jgi:gentisate 1,2-dioxygenase
MVMATYTVTTGKYAAHAKTTTPNTEDTISFADDSSNVEILVESGADVYFSVDGTAATVAGDNTFFVRAGSSAQVPVWKSGAFQVRLISTGAAVYHVARV